VRQKIKTLADLLLLREDAKRAGKPVVFTNGCFDLLHCGHLHLLSSAKAYGDLLIVAVNSDRSVRGIKGPNRPIISERDRANLIAAMEMVDYVTIFDESDPYNLIKALQPNVLAKGGDWSADKIVGAEVVESAGGRVAVIPYLKGYSTTELIAKIRS
jgi:D-beta-D-heptose 7-phosphate kinase/D-beta-D-heptose 1-phosphate adenosyltransferase